MSVTTTKLATVRDNLNSGNTSLQASAMQTMKIGNRLANVKAVITGLTAAAAIDITTAASKAAATITGITLATGENLPPIGHVLTLRVTNVGSGATGPRIVVDAGGAAIAPNTYAGHALISDDGATLTFEGTVTGFILEYVPRAYVALSTGEPMAAP
jgi:hypothetical protein